MRCYCIRASMLLHYPFTPAYELGRWVIGFYFGIFAEHAAKAPLFCCSRIQWPSARGFEARKSWKRNFVFTLHYSLELYMWRLHYSLELYMMKKPRTRNKIEIVPILSLYLSEKRWIHWFDIQSQTFLFKFIGLSFVTIFIVIAWINTEHVIIIKLLHN